jgi:DNA-binding PadR family transcriptional regulator
LSFQGAVSVSVQNVVLGQLVQRRGYGWEIRERLRAFGEAFGISEAAIYAALKKLHERELIAETERAAPQPHATVQSAQRRVFEVTPKGRAFFAAWMAEPASKTPLREELHMQLIVAEESDLPALLVSLREFETSCAEQLARIFASPLDTVHSANVRISAWGARAVQRALVGHLQASIEWAQQEQLALERRFAECCDAAR